MPVLWRVLHLIEFLVHLETLRLPRIFTAQSKDFNRPSRGLQAGMNREGFSFYTVPTAYGPGSGHTLTETPLDQVNSVLDES